MFQYFVLSKRGEIIFNDESCMDYSMDNKLDRIQMWECHGLKGNQEWLHDRVTVSIPEGLLFEEFSRQIYRNIKLSSHIKMK